MAAVVIAATIAIQDRIEKKREAKRLKKLNDDDRYQVLQDETRKRLSRTQSGNIIERPASPWESASVSGEVESPPPPAYHEVVAGSGNGRGGG